MFAHAPKPPCCGRDLASERELATWAWRQHGTASCGRIWRVGSTGPVSSPLQPFLIAPWLRVMTRRPPNNLKANLKPAPDPAGGMSPRPHGRLGRQARPAMSPGACARRGHVSGGGVGPGPGPGRWAPHWHRDWQAGLFPQAHFKFKLDSTVGSCGRRTAAVRATACQ